MKKTQVVVDTSVEAPPRGFPAFDKDQLDPVRREYMQKLRVEMLDHNEEYLAKHPQVEAVLRLIVMEVVCHKPYDVRKFIKQVLTSDSLETRVAKIILSKRINLERSHTRDYFTHVAKWEQNANNSSGDETVQESPWPEPRPARKTKRRDRPGYSHLHYFKDPFWLYPKEFMTNVETREKPIEKTPKYPPWKSAFLKADYFQKWGELLEGDPPKRPEKKRRRFESKRTRALRKALRAQRKKEEEQRILQADGKPENLNWSLVLKCSSCSKALACLDPKLDKRSGEQGPVYKKSSMVRRSRLTIQAIVDKLDSDCKNAVRRQVLYTEDAEIFNQKKEKLVVVCGTLGRHAIVGSTESTSEQLLWWVKKVGEEITFTVPVNELTLYPGDLPRLQYQISDSEVPRKYKSPVYQIIILDERTDEEATPPAMCHVFREYY